MQAIDEYLSACYSDEGRRLTQLFQLAFDPSESSRNSCSVESILLTGDSGTGKSTALDLLASRHQVPLYRITLGQLAAENGCQLDKGFRKYTWKAASHPKSIILLEDIDLFCPKGENVQNLGFTAALHEFIETVQRRSDSHRILLIGTSRQPALVVNDVRNLFQVRQDEIQFQIPTPDERLMILVYLFQSLTLSDDIDPRELSAHAHAFTAADLAHWCRLAEEAAMEDGCDRLSREHFMKMFNRIRVSGLQGAAMAEKPEAVRWSDIGGLASVKAALEESIVWVYKHADAYRRLGVQSSKGVLLYGPPGTGKTMLAKAVATESAANFLPVSIPDLVKGEVGESEKAVVKIFQTAVRCSPCVIFLDELEAVFGTRENSGDVGKKLVSQFLLEIDQLDMVGQSVIVLGATNHPDAIDPSILRPGRLDRLVHVGAPAEEDRLEILSVLAQTTKLSEQVDLRVIASRTTGYTGADLKAVMRKAGLLVLKRNLRKGAEALYIEQEDIEQALETVPASVNVS
ncbi:hypothetical protein EC973_000829 [Apophysomyces ossiformis]|uniref:AAA+ ATPase domain-containing protein n=1 Tax=Apophysomyces ossiformis TaxID=679940 RepID=A0A8H7EPR8_9FUNG|nr:hypothetical protein EC973_000829 [Apophysomyces ossiformis]